MAYTDCRESPQISSVSGTRATFLHTVTGDYIWVCAVFINFTVMTAVHSPPKKTNATNILMSNPKSEVNISPVSFLSIWSEYIITVISLFTIYIQCHGIEFNIFVAVFLAITLVD